MFCMAADLIVRPCAQLRLSRMERREVDLRKRMQNVVAAHNVALTGLDARHISIAER